MSLTEVKGVSRTEDCDCATEVNLSPSASSKEVVPSDYSRKVALGLLGLVENPSLGGESLGE